MKLSKKQKKKIITIVAVLLLTWFYEKISPQTVENVTQTPLPTAVLTTPEVLPAETQTVKVMRVIDGDTIEIEGNLKVRYIGIDTPETSDPRKPVQCFGEAASAKNRELVEGKNIRMEKDVSDTDRYGRLLRYVYIGETMINETLVREGYAISSVYPPDVKYQEIFREAETIARNERRGLWGECNP